MSTLHHLSQSGFRDNEGPDADEVATRNACLFYSEAEAAALLGIHRTTLRTLALEGRAPVEAIAITEHRRLYRRIDIHRLAGLDS